MIRGMTGFGTSSFTYKGKKYVVSIRSVNHKFLDFVINLPEGLVSFEAKIKKSLSQSLKRGRVTFQFTSLEPYSHEPALNRRLLDKYVALIQGVSRYLKIKQEIRLRDIIDLPEVIYFQKNTDYSNRQFLTLLDKATNDALKNLALLRKKEGSAISVDLRKRTRHIEQKLKFVKNRVNAIIAEQESKLSNDELKEFLKNYNIAEEIVRLDFHVKNFNKTLRQNGSVGKILDFITQEMQREINTLSAKLRDSQVSYSSVFIKDEIEKIREQLQNVE